MSLRRETFVRSIFVATILSTTLILTHCRKQSTENAHIDINSVKLFYNDNGHERELVEYGHDAHPDVFYVIAEIAGADTTSLNSMPLILDIDYKDADFKVDPKVGVTDYPLLDKTLAASWKPWISDAPLRKKAASESDVSYMISDPINFLTLIKSMSSNQRWPLYLRMTVRQKNNQSAQKMHTQKMIPMD